MANYTKLIKPVLRYVNEDRKVNAEHPGVWYPEEWRARIFERLQHLNNAKVMLDFEEKYELTEEN